MGILQEYAAIANNLLVRAARSLFREWRLELGGVGIYNSENHQIFSDLSQISTIIEHGFYVRARWASTQSSTTRLVMTIEVELKIHCSCTLMSVAFGLVETRRQAELVWTSYIKLSKMSFLSSHCRSI
jgi:hypothetical protein